MWSGEKKEINNSYEYEVTRLNAGPMVDVHNPCSTSHKRQMDHSATEYINTTLLTCGSRGKAGSTSSRSSEPGGDSSLHC
jgi:hypothetical protein